MPKSRRLLMLALAFIAGATPLLTALAVSGDDFVTLCYKTRTIQVPFYLRLRYIGAGAMDGPCPVSP